MGIAEDSSYRQTGIFVQVKEILKSEINQNLIHLGRFGSVIDPVILSYCTVSDELIVPKT